MSSYLLLISLSSVSLCLLRKRKERGSKKAAEEASESLEAKLREKAETLGLSLEQKTKGMKQRDKKVDYTAQPTLLITNIMLVA